MKVELLTYTPEPEKLVAAAAKLCYSKSGVSDISQKLTNEETDRFLNILMGLGHQSPVEHVSFTFAVEGVSRVLTHQLVRHRIASYSQQSQRYVRLGSFEYVMPPMIEGDPEAKALFEQAMEQDQQVYNQLTDRLMETYMKKFMEEGYTEKKARKVAEKKAIEDARFVFPNACETKIVMTMNARTLLHFFAHRCCDRAQWEIREMATEMLRQAKKVAPTLFVKAGPGCVHGTCPEGAMSCGKAQAVRAFFQSL